MKIDPPPPQNRRKRGGPAFANDALGGNAAITDTKESQATTSDISPEPLSEAPNQLTTSDALERAANMLVTITPAPDSLAEEEAAAAGIPNAKGMTYCPECYLPLHPDPKPERLYIFLHALRYTTSMGKFETEMPEWAAEGWEWDRS